MTKATRGLRAAWMVGLGGSLLWACSSHSSVAVLGDRPGTDAGDVVLDSSITDGGTPPAEGAAPACTLVEGGCVSLENCGAKVNIVQVAQTAPVASAGTVVPGTYVMTDFTIFTGTGGPTGAKGASVIETQYLSLMSDDAGMPTEAGPAGEGGADDGGAAGDAGVEAEAGPASQVFQLLDVSETDTSTGPQTLTGTTTFSSPNRASIVYACPAGAPVFAATYTATSTQLQLFTTEPAGIGVITYTKM